MSSRFRAVELAGQRRLANSVNSEDRLSQTFGKYVFGRSVMEKMLPPNVVRNITRAMEGLERVKEEHADSIAVAMKEWATSLGATHYTHWFQPLTGVSAEKHDAFITPTNSDSVIEKFGGKELIQGEPDASSFPSGGLRSTYEARGYTGWDPSSPVFIWKSAAGTTLCIPSVFISWAGDVLGYKIPLLRSDALMGKASMRLLRLLGIGAQYVYSTLGVEQEYFVVDRAMRNLRLDLLLCSRTIFGAPSPKGQELMDHYFGSVKERVLAFMSDMEDQALKLGIPLKTRHNEVAPSQHEVAPVFEKTSVAVDHNLVLMELMRKIAIKHDLVCLLHEKPFSGMNGSGKHANWSLTTDTGFNLLNPSENPQNSLSFLILLTAVLQGIYRHSDLLRSVVGSAGNDHRLGGHEAPPAIVSVYLGEALEALLVDLEEKGEHVPKASGEIFDLGADVMATILRDNTDRNRTSPFAFTGNKFEFRAVGSAANPSFSVTVINAAVAESLNEVLDEIEGALSGVTNPSKEEISKAALPVLKRSLQASRPIRFTGDSYCIDWEKEAEKRGLSNIKKSVFAYAALELPSTEKVFKGILAPQELSSRYEMLLDRYVNTLAIEANCALQMWRTQIYPAAVKHQKNLAKSLTALQQAGVKSGTRIQYKELEDLVILIEQAMKAADSLACAKERVDRLDLKEKAASYCDEVATAIENLREWVDLLEGKVDDVFWPIPKYQELLFIS